MAKFNTEAEFDAWCVSVVMKIYYANIAMNNEIIANAVQEIARKLHVSEGEHLIEEPR